MFEMTRKLALKIEWGMFLKGRNGLEKGHGYLLDFTSEVPVNSTKIGWRLMVMCVEWGFYGKDVRRSGRGKVNSGGSAHGTRSDSPTDKL
jgi:hypothetical protein